MKWRHTKESDERHKEKSEKSEKKKKKKKKKERCCSRGIVGMMMMMTVLAENVYSSINWRTTDIGGSVLRKNTAGHVQGR